MSDDEIIEDIKFRIDNIGKTNKKLLQEKRRILSINKDLIIENEYLRAIKFKYFKELIEHFEEYVNIFFEKIPFWDTFKKNPYILQLLKKFVLPIISIGYYILLSRYLRVIDILIFQIITNLLIIYYTNYYSDLTLTCVYT